MGAAHSLDGDLALAVGAHLGGGLLRLGGLGRLSVQGVDKLDHNEQHKGHDEKVDDGVDELADLDAGAAQSDDHIGKIRLEEQADQRVDDVLHQRGDNCGEGTADDNAHCHVQHVAAHGKCLELFKELFDAAFFLFHR